MGQYAEVTKGGEFSPEELQKQFDSPSKEKFNYTPPPRHITDRRFKKKGKQNDINNLWELHHEIIRRLALGQKAPEIAAALNITVLTVSNIRNSTLGSEKLEAFRDELDLRTLDIGERIQETQGVALEFLLEIVSGNVPGTSLPLRAKLATEHLERGGYGAIRKVAKFSQTLTKDDLERIKRNALQGAKEMGVIEAEFSEQ